jgi:hypothetical protein
MGARRTSRVGVDACGDQALKLGKALLLEFVKFHSSFLNDKGSVRIVPHISPWADQNSMLGSGG